MSGLTNIEIGFSKSNSWVSHAIEAVQAWACHIRGKERADVPSHAFVKACLGTHELILGADTNGFVAQKKERFVASNRIISTPKLLIPLDAAQDKIIDLLDDDYGFAGLFYELWNAVKRRIGRRSSNPWSRSNRPYCSTACVQILQAAGYPGADRLDNKSCWPVDLKRFLEGA